MKKYSRRQFLKDSIVAGTAVTAFPGVLSAFNNKDEKWDKIVVHPNVDNLKVVGITDPKMTSIQRPICDWPTQDKIVRSKVVSDNIDKMACALTEKKSPDSAWRNIFIKPPGKSWADTIVAIKTNNIAYQHTRSAVMAKICNTLTKTLGVAPHNIHIYDAKHGKDMQTKTPFTGLPDGCQINNNWGGITTPVSIPKPWKEGTQQSKCLTPLADGTIDILINIAVCKGHRKFFGGYSLTMKNHLGTFWPEPVHKKGGGMDYVIAINKSDLILGPIDKVSWKIIHPRQQLCIVDALWASEEGPGCFPSIQPNFLAMGVFSPIVDYIIATQFRAKKMGWSINKRATNRLLTEFGYKKADFPQRGRLFEI